MSAEQPSAQAQLRLLLESLWHELATNTSVEARDPVASYQIHIDTPHGPLRIGIDATGARHLLLPVASEVDVRDERSSGVGLSTRVLLVEGFPTRFADLVCRRRDLDGVFTGLCADVCERAIDDPVGAGERLASTLAGWRDLLSGRQEPWNRSRLAGLFGELLVLERVLTLRPSAAGSWVGPVGAPQDFRSPRHAIEVKSTSGLTGRAVRVHGSDQLERPADGTLTLAWFRLALDEKGTTVRDLLKVCLEAADSAASILTKLDALALPALTDPLLSTTAFTCTEERWFEVDADFPRVTPDRFVDAALPQGVGNVEYTLDLDYVPGPFADSAVAISRLVEDL